MYDRELRLTDLLADPVTLAVMAADQVDPAALAAALSGLARTLELARPAVRGGCGGNVRGAPARGGFRRFFPPPPTHNQPGGISRLANKNGPKKGTQTWGS